VGKLEERLTKSFRGKDQVSGKKLGRGKNNGYLIGGFLNEYASV